MKRISLELAELSLMDHRSVQTALTQVLPEIPVSEEDDRRLRETGPLDAGVIAGIIGAAAAVIGLWFQWRQLRIMEEDKQKRTVEEALVRVETQLGLSLPPDLKQSLRELLLKGERPLLIDIAIGAISYRLTVYEGDDLLLIKGHRLAGGRPHGLPE